MSLLYGKCFMAALKWVGFLELWGSCLPPFWDLYLYLSTFWFQQLQNMVCNLHFGLMPYD